MPQAEYPWASINPEWAGVHHDIRKFFKETQGVGDIEPRLKWEPELWYFSRATYAQRREVCKYDARCLSDTRSL